MSSKTLILNIIALLAALIVKAQSSQLSAQNDSLFKFYLSIVKIEVDEGPQAPYNHPDLYYIAYIDQNTKDTLFKNKYLDNAIKFLQFHTNIYIRKGKYGGYILTKSIYNQWLNWYKQHSLSTKP